MLDIRYAKIGGVDDTNALYIDKLANAGGVWISGQQGVTGNFQDFRNIFAGTQQHKRKEQFVEFLHNGNQGCHLDSGICCEVFD